MLAAKQEVVDAAKQQLVGNTQLLRQLQRRAGIEAAEGGSGGEVEAAFTAAVAEHEAKLRVQYAGEPGSWVLGAWFVTGRSWGA